MMALRITHLLLCGASLAVALKQDDEHVSMLQTKLSVNSASAARQKALPEPALAALAALRNPATQKSACETLMNLAPSHRDELMTATFINPAMDAIKDNVADLEVVYSCFDFLRAFQATFDRPTTLAINNGTHIGEAVAAVLRFYPYNREVQKDVLLHVAEFSTYVACEVQPPYVEAGCLELVWDALDHFPGREFSDVQMSAWQGFSDHSYCPFSAEAIANHGGRNAGIRRIVHALEEARGNDFRPDEKHGGSVISLQYEIMAVANGLLQVPKREIFEAFVSSGYGPAVLAAMRDQPEERSANDRGCAALQMLSADEAVRAELLADGALEVAAATMDRYKGDDHTVFVNQEMGDMYPVLPRCDAALRNLAKDNPQVQDALLQLGVLETYGSMRQDLLAKFPEMASLPGLLLARRAVQARAAGPRS